MKPGEIQTNVGTVKLEVPFLETGLPRPKRVDMELSDRQGLGLRGLLDGLQFDGAELASGRRVISPAGAIRWLLERLGEPEERPRPLAAKGLLTRREAAKALRVTIRTIDLWIRSGKLPAYRVGPRIVRLRESDVRGRARRLRRTGSSS